MRGMDLLMDRKVIISEQEFANIMEIGKCNANLFCAYIDYLDGDFWLDGMRIIVDAPPFRRGE